MNYELVKFEQNENKVAVVTICREKAMNALNQQVLSELKQIFSDLKTNDNVNVIVLTGAGEKAFVAGADIKEMKDHSVQQATEMSLAGQEVFSLIEQLGKPVIAAVNGFALGGGFELAMACSFIIASENAKFGLPEVSLGLMPGYGGTQRLPRLIGVQKAKRMIFSGQMVDAQQAYAWGIVTEVVPEQPQLLPQALKVAEKIAKMSRSGIAQSQKSMFEGLHLSLQQALQIESKCFGETFSFPDKKEGISAFLEKRKPQFTD